MPTAYLWPRLAHPSGSGSGNSRGFDFFPSSCFGGGNVSGVVPLLLSLSLSIDRLDHCYLARLGVHQIQELTDRHASTVQPTSHDDDNKNTCDLRKEPKKNKA